MGRHVKSKTTALAALTVAGFFLSLHSGAVHVEWSEVFRFVFGGSLADDHRFLFSALRAPRTVAALAIGGALGICGLVLQTLLKNPLAEPYTLGLSGGSSLGAIIALVLTLEPAPFWIPFLSSLGCLAAAAAVLGLARRRLGLESRSLILFGVMISLFLGAVVVSGLSVLSPQKLQTALFWLLGEFGTSRDVWIYPMAPAFVVLAAAVFSRARALDAMALGEAGALSLGYLPSRERFLLIALCALLTALSVSISGLVGFVGLVSPHVARRFLKTSRHDALLASSALIGALLLVLADTAGRTVAGNVEIPAGSVAALVGAPVLIALLMGENHAEAD